MPSKFRALVTVGNYELPEPAYGGGYIANTATLVDAGRNTEGVTIGTVIRDDVAKIELSWKFLTAQQWADTHKCFKISAGGKFFNTVTFYDQSVAGWVTKTMYVSDRKSGIFRRNPENGDIIGFTDCKLSLVEV